MMDSKKSFRNKKEGEKQRKPLSRKKWRDSHYSTKKKVERWDEVRKKSLIKKYHNELKKSGINIPSNSQISISPRREKKASAIEKAQEKYRKIQEEKQRQKEEIQRRKEERQAALEAYKQKKAMKFKKLSQKTKRGQPVMKGRMELLLEKIQKSYAPQT